MFGYPTGVGALLVKSDMIHLMRKVSGHDTYKTLTGHDTDSLDMTQIDMTQAHEQA